MIRAFRVALATSARRVVAQPSGLVVTLGFYAAVVTVLSALWRTATGANSGAVVGYSAAALTWYVAASEAAIVSLNARMIEQTGEEIASGAVAVELLRPVPMLAIRVASEIGGVLPRIGACMAMGVLLSFALVGAPPNAVALLLVPVALVLAIACNLVAQHAFAGVSFWIRDSRSTWFVYQKLVFVLGGMLLPIEVLPESVENVARFLPFVAMAYVPARLSAGFVEPQLIALQLFWLVALAALASLVFARGERRLQVVGG